MTRKNRIAVLTMMIVALVSLCGARPAAAADSWSYSLTPYLWLPTVNGTLRYEVPPDAGEGNADMGIGPNDYLSNLKFALMLSGDARKGKGSIVTDLVYLDFANQDSSVRSVDFGNGALPVDTTANVDTTTSLKGLEWTIAGGYALSSNPDASLDVIGGARYLGLDTSADWNLTGTVTGPGPGQSFARSGSVSNRANLWDGIVGLRGRVKLADRWNMPYYIDAGAGSSRLTWQGLLGVTYSYGWGDLGLSYRHLSWEQNGDKLIQKLSFSGLSVSATFRF